MSQLANGLKIIDFPLITILIATYNSAKTLRWTLQSVQKQDLQDFEVHIIGDCCTDDSEAVITSFNDPRFHWTNLSERCGVQSGPNNEGLKRALGKYIAYLGHDDLWFPWHLSGLVSCLEHQKSDFVFSLSAFIGPDGVRPPTGPLLPDSFENHFSPPSTWLHRKDLIDACGFWNCSLNTLKFPVDRDFWRRVFQMQKRMHFHPSLSVLKFPSPWWGSYALKQNHPQEPFLLHLHDDPQNLQVQILTNLLMQLSRRIQLKRWWRQCIVKIVYFYGIDRFPVSFLKRWHYQWQRQRDLKLRGLG